MYAASRIRGSVAQVPFDEFHRYSVKIIKKAVFGEDVKGNVNTRLLFDANNLVINRLLIIMYFVVTRSMLIYVAVLLYLAVFLTNYEIRCHVKRNS
jgi:major vault protein